MNQTTLTFGRMQMEQGIERVTKKAEKTHPGWLDLAFAWIALYVSRLKRGDEFTAEMLVEASVEHGILQPHNDKAWAGPIKRAHKAKLIEKTGKPGVCRKRHNSPCVTWKKP